VGKAVWAGIFTRSKPFMRTPKCEDPAKLSQVLRMAWQETALFLACALAFVSMFGDRWYESPAVMLWMTMLAIQATPYAATVVTAILSAFSHARISEAPSLPQPDSKPVLPRAA
jgi:hypothetical protein